MKLIKRRKKTRLRGTHTHGWGAKKKHRGAGNRGGRGMAGTGKRADQKKTFILKTIGNKYFGKTGFKIPQKMKIDIKIINLDQLNKIKKDNIDLKELGYNKLLGKGKITKKLIITVPYSSKKAIEKIEKAGGEVKTTAELKNG